MLVGIADSVALKIVYQVAGVPHPILFGAAMAAAAIIPLAFGIAAALLLANGAPAPAIVVLAVCLVVTFVTDHVVRPPLIGGATHLPFLLVPLDILCGSETLGLLGPFVGPVVMSALILLWQEMRDGDEIDGQEAALVAHAPLRSGRQASWD